jgi:stress responsive alpha/beta barrel protein
MFVHVVYFWLQPNLSPADTAAFIAGVTSLTTINTVQHAWVGVPAATDRPIIDRSYSYSLVVVFADQDGHDTYQVDPIHDRFRDECGTFWSRVVIYDSIASVSV